MINIKLNYPYLIKMLETIQLCANKWDLAHLKMLSTNYSFTNHMIYIYIYIYKQNLALNNKYGLICHKTQWNQSTTFLLSHFPYQPIISTNSLHSSSSSSSCHAASTDLSYPLSSLVYRPLLLGGLPGYILYWHTAVVYRF